MPGGGALECQLHEDLAGLPGPIGAHQGTQQTALFLFENAHHLLLYELQAARPQSGTGDVYAE